MQGTIYNQKTWAGIYVCVLWQEDSAVALQGRKYEKDFGWKFELGGHSLVVFMTWSQYHTHLAVNDEKYYTSVLNNYTT